MTKYVFFLQLGVDSDHIFQQNNYPFTEDPMFPLPEAPPDNVTWSNAQCLIRIREDQLIVIDGGYQSNDGLPNDPGAFFIRRHSVSTRL